MGSWNGTCGVTQLPITAGMRVAAIPLLVKLQDFSGPSTLSGSGVVANNRIAQPIGLPVFGSYDDCGGVRVDRRDLGHRYLREMLQGSAKVNRLWDNESGRPKQVKRLPARFFEPLCRGELLMSCPNVDKFSLIRLKQTIADAGSMKGFEHYANQLKVDPDLLPNFIELGLGVMLVPEQLYLNLAAAVGGSESFGYYDGALQEVVHHGATRAEELRYFATPEPKAREKVLKKRAKLLARADASNSTQAAIIQWLPLSLVPRATKVYADHLLYPGTADAALREVVVDGNEQARNLFVNYFLFVSAMESMRKQWTVQTGAGDASGLGDVGDLYRVAHDFVGQQLADAAES